MIIINWSSCCIQNESFRIWKALHNCVAPMQWRFIACVEWCMTHLLLLSLMSKLLCCPQFLLWVMAPPISNQWFANLIFEPTDFIKRCTESSQHPKYPRWGAIWSVFNKTKQKIPWRFHNWLLGKKTQFLLTPLVNVGTQLYGNFYLKLKFSVLEKNWSIVIC